MKYTLGLDLGTTSVGWAVINNELDRIEDLGVRVFESAENPKDGKSLALPRREARSLRRRLARRRYRLDKTKSIFKAHGILSSDEIDKLLQRTNDPYKFRAEGLDRILSNEELFITVYHLVKRRGYKSNRKKVLEGEGAKANENKVVLEGIRKNDVKMQQGKYRTPGEMLFALKKANKEHRLRNASGSYEYSFSREMLENELKLLLESQQKLGNRFVDETLVSDLVGYENSGKAKGVFNHQRPFASGDQIKDMVGKCTFEKDEIRAAKATYRFEYFNVLQKMNSLKIKNDDKGDRELTSEEKEKLVAEIKTKKTVTYQQIKKWLNLDQKDRFNMVSYFVSRKKLDEGISAEDQKDDCEKAKFPSMTSFFEIKKKIRGVDPAYWERVKEDEDILDAIGNILTIYKTDEDISKAFLEMSMPQDVINALLGCSFSKFGHLSGKALSRLIPLLEQGKRYDEAVAMIPEYKDRFSGRGVKLRPIAKDDHSITNPVVKRTIAQAIKVVNAIIDRYGSPTEIHIELGRDLAKDFRERQRILKQQRVNQERNEDAKKKIAELFGVQDPKGMDILKYRLWAEQNNKCGYSGSAIDEKRLLEAGYAEVDHIIPFSRSFDDSFNNKVLVLKKENQEKGNRTPYEYIGHNEEKWHDFVALVNSQKNISSRKRSNLLTKKFVADDLTARTLNDTRFIARYLKNYIENTLEFASDTKKKQKVFTVNGMATAYVRKRWGLNKIRDAGDKHHALDAAVVAVITSGMVQSIMKHAKADEIADYLKVHNWVNDELEGVSEDDVLRAKEYLRRHELRRRLPEPWPGFHHELLARLSDDPSGQLRAKKEEISAYKSVADFSDIKPIFVSRMPRRKVTGQLHKETLKSAKRFENEMAATLKTDLKNLSLKVLVEKGDALDPNLKKELVKRLEEFDDDAEKAFAEPFYKTKKDGTRGPLVRSVKLIEKNQKSGLVLTKVKAVVDQASMIRVDVFSKVNKKHKEEYYLVPVYAYQTSWKELPNKYIVRGKPEKDWGEIDETFDFKFSLYPGDLIRVENKGEVNYWYYQSASRSTASFTVKSHDGSKSIDSLGIKTADKLDKYVVGVLGDLHKVKNEKRLGFSRKSR